MEVLDDTVGRNHQIEFSPWTTIFQYLYSPIQTYPFMLKPCLDTQWAEQSFNTSTTALYIATTFEIHTKRLLKNTTILPVLMDFLKMLLKVLIMTWFDLYSSLCYHKTYKATHLFSGMRSSSTPQFCQYAILCYKITLTRRQITESLHMFWKIKGGWNTKSNNFLRKYKRRHARLDRYSISPACSSTPRANLNELEGHGQVPNLLLLFPSTDIQRLRASENEGNFSCHA